MSGCHRIDVIEHLPPHGERACIAPVDHGAGRNGCPRPQVGQAIEIDIVEDARAV
jgi:hypothetical protein